MSMLKVRELMTHPVETLEPGEDLDLADMIMRLERFRHLPVVNDGRVVGLLSQRDILAAQASNLKVTSREQQRLNNLHIRVEDVMTKNVMVTTPDAPALKAAELMREHHIGCLPVVEDGLLVGIITESDFLTYVIRSLSDPSI